MKSPVALLIILIFSFHTAFAQKVELSAAVNRNQVLIGEPVQLFLKALVPKSAPGTWFVVDTIPHFEIMERSVIDTQVTEKGLFLQQTITLTSWDSGRWQLPPFVIGRTGTQPLAITVSYSPMDPNQPYHDIKDIMDVQKGEGSSWYWYLLGIAVLIALFLLFFPPGEKKDKTAPAEDPYKAAIRRLKKLEPGSEDKAFYTELVDIFRVYLSQKRGIASHSKTTEDLVRQLEALDLKGDDYRQLTATLQLSDMVKFARFASTRQEQEESQEVILKNIQTIEAKS